MKTRSDPWRLQARNPYILRLKIVAGAELEPALDSDPLRGTHGVHMAALQTKLTSGSAWVSGKEVVAIALPQSFASLRGPLQRAHWKGNFKAMSADTLLTTQSQGRFPISRKGALTCGSTL